MIKKYSEQNVFFVLFILVATLLMVVVSSEAGFEISSSSFTNNSSNLSLWDDTDTILTPKFSGQNIFFYGNYTLNDSGAALENGQCQIKFENSTHVYGSLLDMVFNSTYDRFQYNKSFDYKGNFYFQVNCSNASNYFIASNDSFNVTNSVPVIDKEYSSDRIDIDGDVYTNNVFSCTEDTLCFYDFSQNVSDADTNDVLVYGYETENTTLEDYSLNASSGNLTINVTTDANSGTGKKIVLSATDNDPGTTLKLGQLFVDITAVNDAPLFLNLSNLSWNELRETDSPYTLSFLASDEENNVPLIFNVSFVSCVIANWSNRTDNCTLFSWDTYNNTAINLSFKPTNDYVGSYLINFSVRDTNNEVTPYNATTSVLVNFTIINVNDLPSFTYVCDNERNVSEDGNLTCRINVTDIDELSNFTLFSSNLEWFLDEQYVNASNESASVLVNLTSATLNDSRVGNWSVNVSVTDSNTGSNSTVFWFYVANVNDSVSIYELPNLSYFVGNSYVIPINATDNDLYIPAAVGSNVYSENLTFNLTYLNGSEVSWITLVYGAVSGNRQDANLTLTTTAALIGDYQFNLSVVDDNGFSADSTLFNISVGNNSAPVWNVNSSLICTEASFCSFNLSQNVTDANGDSLTFSYTTPSGFPSFSVSSAGIINFTGNDSDVGYHSVNVSVTDGKTPTVQGFTFNISNVNDVPAIESIQANNATVEAVTYNINTSEDNIVEIILWVQDNDFNIPASQRSFYNESLTINLTITGPNSSLFNFTKSSTTFAVTNRTQYTASFIPRKADVGNYTLTLNVSDLTNASDYLEFNLTIATIEHSPVMSSLVNQTSAVGRTIYYQINATDTEDGYSQNSSNLTFSITNLSGIYLFNSSTFNSTSGLINLTLASNQGGRYRLNVTVNDSSNRQDSEEFWLNIYDVPNVSFPATDYNFSLVENGTSNLIFTTNHSIGNNLTYFFYLNGTLRYNLTSYGNGSNLTWAFTPNLTDETYSEYKSLSLVVYPSDTNLSNRELINRTISWNANISHLNSPLEFEGTIANTSGGSPQTISLSNYFGDIDASDPKLNQTIGFVINTVNGGSGISVSFTNWTNGTSPTVTFSSSATASGNYTITAYEYNISNTSQATSNVTSNIFTIDLTTTTTVVTTPTSGGGGGSSPKYNSIKIIFSESTVLIDNSYIEIPFEIKNTGQSGIYDLIFSSSVLANNLPVDAVNISFSNKTISSLASGASEKLTMRVFSDTTKEGRYKATIFVNITTPSFSDWGEFVIELRSSNKSEAEKILIFTEKLISENPKCLELTELVKEARKAFDAGEIKKALDQSSKISDACEKAISSNEQFVFYKDTLPPIFYYSAILTAIIFIVIFIIYIYKRVRFIKYKSPYY